MKKELKLEIKINDEVYKKTALCGVRGEPFEKNIAKNCAISFAVREIFPGAITDLSVIYVPKGLESLNIELPEEATRFISHFDYITDSINARIDSMKPPYTLEKIVEKRKSLGDFSFTIFIPEELIDEIGINEIKDIINNSNTLELVN